MPEYIDVAIPRGGEGLIRRVAAEAKMPVIKHFDGNCHVYVDAAADLDMAREIVVNSKCQRMGVCNAAESLLVHSDVAAEFLPAIAAGAGQARRRDPRRRADVRARRRRQAGDRGGLRAPSSSARSFRPASSARSTRRSSTSIATARTTPTRS